MLDNLRARMEIKLHAPDTRKTPVSVFEVLRDLYGGRQTFVQLQQRFMSENKKRVNR